MKNLWDITARIYPWLRLNPVSRHFLQEERESITALLSMVSTKTDACVADIGVGRGHSLSILPATAQLKFALDKNFKMLSLTKPAYPDTLFIQGDVLKLPLKNSTFDLVFCIGVLEYVENIHRLLTQLYKIIKINGHLLLTSSPKNTLTYLRLLTGQKIYPRNVKKVEHAISTHSFNIIDIKSTHSQNQFLLCKE